MVVDRFGAIFSRTWCIWEIWQVRIKGARPAGTEGSRKRRAAVGSEGEGCGWQGAPRPPYHTFTLDHHPPRRAMQASQSERFDKLVMVSTSWAWEDLVHAYLTLDIGRTQATRDRERLMLLGEMHKAADLAQLANTLRESMLSGSKREMQRAEKLASVNPRRFGAAATTFAMLLTMHCRYGEAEDIMRQVSQRRARRSGR